MDEWWRHPVTGGLDWELYTFPLGCVVIVIGSLIWVVLTL